MDYVAVNGVPAYSTLGWFDDPIFHSVLHWPNAQIAGLIHYNPYDFLTDPVNRAAVVGGSFSGILIKL